MVLFIKKLASECLSIFVKCSFFLKLVLFIQVISIELIILIGGVRTQVQWTYRLWSTPQSCFYDSFQIDTYVQRENITSRDMFRVLGYVSLAINVPVMKTEIWWNVLTSPQHNGSKPTFGPTETFSKAGSIGEKITPCAQPSLKRRVLWSWILGSSYTIGYAVA